MKKPERTVVVGTSCSGKTVLARQIAEALRIRHVEIDAIHWQPNWEMPTREDFRARVAEATSGDEWVIDGNYGTVRDIVWNRATHVVWLNYPFHVVFRRALTRTIRRILTQEKVCGENRESFVESFLHKDGIPPDLLGPTKAIPRAPQDRPVRSHGSDRTEKPA